ncbi:universal stress protein [Halobaculum sp. CBA1158]|uniref:universal stress protein n=1 Tax=Halobaculum sp. CBA1158 TaxID=2904243 RepID=UPI001F24C40B|nr:universal stress protein [Halobaculum sp. CBA1158]UIP00962.1 universal stress protein [Halobaculum sp. CBA1158]
MGVMLYVLATNSAERSEVLCDYLEPRLDASDAVHAVNSHRGGDRTTQGELDRGEEALAVVETRLSRVTDVETHQLVRGNSPAEDVIGFVERHDADEIVMGVRKRSTTGKVLFGSVAQDIFMQSPVPMRVVPVDDRR